MKLTYSKKWNVFVFSVLLISYSIFCAWIFTPRILVIFNWKETSGTVKTLDFEHLSRTNGASVTNALITYRYDVDGKEYKNDRYSLWGHLTVGTFISTKQAVRTKFNPNSKVNVRYDPDSPMDSIIASPIGFFDCFLLILWGLFCLPLICTYSKKVWL
ncbi:DUF3592 domain-containing protein [Puniceicoccus vermicola]|uniref:DUF3592 domain-containing protein n=1 Tax=Puniceicoccus vermicola TaxID=388746 RepID=A0A7X1E5L0_9BACT|nr:DUF3592 domain-containing protein [Puniceicoccus vermicola]